MPTPLRVLIVENRLADAELMVHELEQAGFKPEWQRVEIEADYLAQLRTVPDIILADHTLPQFGAPQAIELLKKSGLDIPLIVVTGSISEEIAVERIKQGAADYILKDRMGRLGVAATNALDDKKLRDEKKRTEDEVRRNLERIRALHEIDIAIGSTLDLSAVLNIVLEKTELFFSYPAAATVRLKDKDSGQLLRVACRNLDLEEWKGRPHVRGGLSVEAFQNRAPAIVQNVQTDSRSQDPGFFRRHGLVSYLGVPMIAKDEIVGILGLYTKEEHKFTNDEVELLSTLAGRAAIAIHNSQLYEDAQKALRRVQAMHEIDTAITSTLDLRAVLDILLEKIDLVLPYSVTTVRLLNKESGQLEPVACRNINEEEWRTAINGADKTLTRALPDIKAPLMIRNVQTDPRSVAPNFLRKHGLVSALRVPLIAEGEVLGVLTFFTKEEHEFTNEEIEFLSTLADQASIAIENSRLYERTKEQALQLEKSNKVKDEFLSVMSHELRTPLNVVMGYSAMIKDGMLGEINPKQEDALRKVLTQVKDQLGMINNILYTTALEANRFPVERQVVTMAEFFNELTAAYFDLSLGKSLNLTWDCPPDFPVLETDRAKLKHILQNLIDNAIKFTEEGTIAISARHIAEEKKVVFQVADTGIGIPKEQLPSIFDKFRQVDSSETRNYGGVGLGLYIVKQFTEILGGRVEAESEEGKGSTFTVTLPLNPGHRLSPGPA